MILNPIPLGIKINANKFMVMGLADGVAPVTAHSPEPFTTKRLLVGAFSVAAPVLRRAVEDAVNRKWFRLAPPVWAMIQPMEMVDGRLSEVEERVLSELAEAAGVDKVVVWAGPDLSDAEALDRLKTQYCDSDYDCTVVIEYEH